MPTRIAALLSLTLFTAHLLGQNSLSLHDAVQEALLGPNAQIADGQVEAAQGQLRQAGLGPNPRIYIQSEDIRPWDSSFSFTNGTEDYAYIGQTFELDGKRKKRVALAAANVRHSENQRVLRTRQIAGDVAAAYWTAVANRRIATLLQQDVAVVDEMVEYHKQRVDAGAMRGVDLIRMQIERDRIFLSLQNAKRDADLALIELSTRIGRSLPATTPLIDDISTTEQVPDVDLATALAQRVELTIARDQVAAAEADLKLQRALAVSDPDLLAGYKRNSGADTLFFAAQVPLSFRNRNQGEIARAEAQLRVAHASLLQTEIVVRGDVQQATENYKRETLLVRETLPQMRQRAKQNLDILTKAYRIGGVDLLRYIDAERTDLEVEVTAIRTLAEFHQAALRLQLAYGGQP